MGSKEHLLGPVLDAGNEKGSAGARYHHTHTGGSGCDGLGAVGWFGYGADIRGAFSGALVSYATGRAGMLGDAMGMAVELGLGGGTDFNTVRPSALAGLFFSMYVVDLGGSYEFPITDDEPDWLGGLQFALRVYVPVSKYDEYDEPRASSPIMPKKRRQAAAAEPR